MKRIYILIAAACALLLFGLLWQFIDLKIAGLILYMTGLSAAVLYFLYVVTKAINEFKKPVKSDNNKDW